MNYASQKHDLYRSISAATLEARLPKLHQALALAAEAGDEDSLYELNLSLFTTASAFGDAPTMLAAFDAVIERRMADPARFPAAITTPVNVELGYQSTLLLESLGRNAAITREQVMHVLSSLQHLFELSGTAASNIPRQRLVAAIDLGDVSSWGRLAAELQAQPIDTENQCEACIQHDLAGVHRIIDGADAGIAIAERMLREGISCPIEPATTLAGLLVPALLNGNSDFVRRHLPRVKDLHLPYCEERMALRTPLLALSALTENVALGLAAFEAQLPDLALVLHDDANRLEFLAHSAVLLDRATTRGLGDRAVRDTVGVLTAQGLGDPDETVSSLAPKLWAAAEQIAARFDAGRGNSFRRDRVAEIRSWTSVSLPMSLGAEAAEPLVAQAAPQPRTSQEWAAWAKLRAELPDPAGAFEACNRALASGELDASQRSQTLAYRLRAHARLAQAEADATAITDLDQATQVELASEFEQLLASLIEIGKPTQAAILDALGLTRYDTSFEPEPDQLTALLDEFRDAAPSDRAVLESYLAESLAAAGRADEAAEMAIRAGEHAESGDDLDLRQSKRLSTGNLLGLLDRPEALTWLDRAIADAADMPSVHATGLMLRARVCANAGDLTSAADALAQAGRLYAGMSAPEWAANAVQLQSSILESTGDLTGAARAMRRSLELTEAVEGFNRVPARIGLGRLLVSAGQAEQGLDVLIQADAELQATDQFDLTSSLTCAYWLGQAELSLGHPETAAKLWQAALDLARGEHGDPEQVSVFGWTLGNLFADHGQWDASLEAFETTRSAAEAADNPLATITLDERVGLITCLSGDPSGLDTLARARTLAESVGADWHAADITDSMARGLNSLGRVDEAVAAALDASDRFGAAGDEPRGQQAFALAATILAGAERVDEAIALLEPVADHNPDWAELLANLQQHRN